MFEDPETAEGMTREGDALAQSGGVLGLPPCLGLGEPGRQFIFTSATLPAPRIHCNVIAPGRSLARIHLCFVSLRSCSGPRCAPVSVASRSCARPGRRLDKSSESPVSVVGSSRHFLSNHGCARGKAGLIRHRIFPARQDAWQAALQLGAVSPLRAGASHSIFHPRAP